MSQYVVSGRSKQTIKSWMKKADLQTAAGFLSFCNNYRRAWGCGCDYVKAIGHEVLVGLKFVSWCQKEGLVWELFHVKEESHQLQSRWQPTRGRQVWNHGSLFGLQWEEWGKDKRWNSRLRGATSWLFVRGFINKIWVRLYAGVMEIPNVERVMWASQAGACLLSGLKKFSLALHDVFISFIYLCV